MTDASFPLLWANVIGHAGISIYHQASGSPLISDMFNLVQKLAMVVSAIRFYRRVPFRINAAMEK